MDNYVSANAGGQDGLEFEVNCGIDEDDPTNPRCYDQANSRRAMVYEVLYGKNAPTCKDLLETFKHYEKNTQKNKALQTMETYETKIAKTPNRKAADLLVKKKKKIGRGQRIDPKQTLAA